MAAPNRSSSPATGAALFAHPAGSAHSENWSPADWLGSQMRPVGAAVEAP